MIRLLLVDDQEMFRQGLAALLTLEDDLEVVGQAGHGQAAIALAEQLQPDIILMDVQMPVCDGVTATQAIHQRFPWIRILVLTTFDHDHYIWQSLQAGALGYILKSATSKQIAAAIRTLNEGYTQLGPTIAHKLFTQLNTLPPSVNVDERYRLSDRELEILTLLGQGKTNQEIAQLLHLAHGTVKNHISRILNELGLSDRTQAALWAREHGLVTPPTHGAS
ncbi:MAG TPA: response regulator transcription factor [Chroococcidiopsis sp.]